LPSEWYPEEQLPTPGKRLSGNLPRTTPIARIKIYTAHYISIFYILFVPEGNKTANVFKCVNKN
jgi:hypothetical protein